MIRNIFINPADNRWRAGWRILAFLILYFSISTLLSLFAIWRGFLALDASFAIVGEPANLLKGKLLELAALLAAVYAARRALDRRSFESLGYGDHHAGRDTLAGVGIAAAMMGLIYLIFRLAGWNTLDGFIWTTETGWWRQAVILLVLFVLVGFSEELQFRGYILQNVEAGLGRGWAVALSALFFASLHLLNPDGFKWLSFLGLTLAGVFFAFAYYRTRTLWLATGIHIGWNFFESQVFGFPVSGLGFPGIIRQTITGPELWTGGAFGPEAGLALLPALALGAALIYALTRDREAVRD
jgi:membrane protease YdiL (CAAX protease family)